MAADVHIDEATLIAIRRAVAEELDYRSRVDAETHYLHHEVLKQWVECQKRRRELVLAVAKHVLGWGTVLGIGWIGKVVWDAFASAARAAGSPH